jgi:hypothetical protein
MMQKIAAFALGLVLLGAWEPRAAPPAGKGNASSTQKVQAVNAPAGKKNPAASPGTRRSAKVRDCLKKYHPSIAKQPKGQGKEFQALRKQIWEVKQRLERTDPELALLQRKRNALAESSVKPGAGRDSALQREMADTEKKVHEREAALYDHPDLKALTAKMQENNRKQLESWRSLAAQDKACSELVPAASNHSKSRKPLSGSGK